MAGNTELGAVFYCDGGSRPTSSGYGGYGVHGYTYDMVKEIKASRQFKDDVMKYFEEDEKTVLA